LQNTADIPEMAPNILAYKSHSADHKLEVSCAARTYRYVYKYIMAIQHPRLRQHLW